MPNRAAGRQYDLPSVSTELGAFIPDISNEFRAGGYRDIQLYLREAPVHEAQGRAALLSDLQATATIDADETLAQLEDGPVPEADPEDPETPAATIDNNTSARPRYLSYIHPEHALYGPLAYPIFYSTGGRSYHRHIKLSGLTKAGGARKNTNVTPVMYYRRLLYTRRGDFNILHRGGMLFQQWLVDAFLTDDLKNMEFYRFNQGQLRAEKYSTAIKAFSERTEPDQVGRRYILPSTVKGSVRFMQQRYQDSMAIVRHFGNPTFFITFTCNPYWSEVHAELFVDPIGAPIQAWRDRSDLVCRVFHLKLRALLDDVIGKDGVLGPHLAHVWVIEYQKRGMPHAHILLWMEPGWKYDRPELVDEVVSAEIPDPSTPQGRLLYGVVTKHLIHGPCGEDFPNAPCMDWRDGKRFCTKGFPRAFSAETVISSDAYPVYRRRNDSPFAFVRPHSTYPCETTVVGNEWVVPHNPYLAAKYQAHINVEVCSSIKAIKYIHKYIYKGPDRGTAEFEVDEIREYLNGRYVGSSEAVWRLFEFPVNGMTPSVLSLVVHCEDEHTVAYDPGATAEEAADEIKKQTSPLVEFFRFCRDNPDVDFTYQDAPLHLTWNKKCWKRRVQQGTLQIGRIHLVNPLQGEVYYLRRLLTQVKGPKSYEDLRTVPLTPGEVPIGDYEVHTLYTDGSPVRVAIYRTFRDACYARNIIPRDDEWLICFREAITLRTGWELRRMFVSAMLHGDLDDARSIWNEFKEYFCERLREEIERFNLAYNPHTLPAPHLDYGLFLIAGHLYTEDKTLSDFGLPPYINDWGEVLSNPLLRQELDYNVDEQARLAQEYEASLNNDQRTAYTRILSKMESDPYSAHFFLHGPGGTGKTFLYRTLCARLRSQGQVVLCVASTGIASLLLPGGRTAHKRFNLPLEPVAGAQGFISRGTQAGRLMRHVSLIIWDETPMMHKEHFDIVDRNLRDLREDLPGGDHPFGGVPVVLGGDFQQILPVIPRGTRGETVHACLQHASIWPRLERLQLRQNMRLDSESSPENLRLGTWLQEMSHDPQYHGLTTLPEGLSTTMSLPTFVERIYPTADLITAPSDPAFFTGRAILSVHNESVHELNDILLDRMPGTTTIQHSFDSCVMDDDDWAHPDEITPEFLNSIQGSGLPLGHLRLKIGAPIIILRNIDPINGLCNGTRCTVSRITSRCLEVRLNNPGTGSPYRLIYRCKLTADRSGLPFTLIRRQFPIRLAYAMTINKAQGQSLSHVGIDLRVQPFSHGQLYVALSRTTNAENVSLLLSPDNTDRKVDNVVYPEVLQDFSPSRSSPDNEESRHSTSA